MMGMPTTLMKPKAVSIVSGTNNAINANVMTREGMILTPNSIRRSLMVSSSGNALSKASSAATSVLHFHHITPSQNRAATTAGPMANSSMAGCIWLKSARR